MTRVLIQTVTLNSALARIDFASIPAGFTDLVFTASARATTATGVIECLITFNGTRDGYTGRGAGAIASAVNNSPSTGGLAFQAPSAAVVTGVFSSSYGYIPNYRAPINKNYWAESSGSTAALIFSGVWANTSPITSISFAPTTNNFAVGTTISLYGITEGSDGIVTTTP
jgi:hypothetical protein